MMFINVQVYNKLSGINQAFQEIQSGAIDTHGKWSFEMTYQADESQHVKEGDLVIVPVWRKNHNLEYHIAQVTKLWGPETTTEDFNFSVNFISAKLSLDGKVKELVDKRYETERKAKIMNQMKARAEELKTRAVYQKLAETDPEMKRLFEQMYE